MFTTGCHTSCTGLNQCYGPMASQCCSYNDGGNCTDDCGLGRVANSTFHCVESNNFGMLSIIFAVCFHIFCGSVIYFKQQKFKYHEY